MFFVVLFCVLSNLQTGSLHSPVNVVLGKMATHCSGTTYQLTDGLTNEIISIDCTSVMYIEVDFGKSYFIYYVILYSELGDALSNTFDKFIVALFNGQEEKSCGSYHANLNVFISESNGYRVNCKKYREKFNKVAFRAEINGMLSANLTEVAAYTFSTLKNPDEQFFYLGCYTDSDDIKDFLFENIFDCSKKCLENNLILMAIKKSSQKCICGMSLKGYQLHQSSLFLCDIPCSDRYPNCGHVTSAYSVYLLDVKLPSIEVCLDENERVFEQYSANLLISMSSVSSCIKHCDDYLYAFIGKGKCSCVNQSISHIEHRRCMYACSGGETCNGFVFFSTCRSLDFPYLSCKNLFRSSDFNMYGVSVECKPSGYRDKSYALPHCIGFERAAAALNDTTYDVPEVASSGTTQHDVPETVTEVTHDTTEDHVSESVTNTTMPGKDRGTPDTGGSESIVGMVETSLFMACFVIAII